VGVSFSPFAAGRTRIAGGFSITHDAVPLEPFGRPFDQTGLTTEYDSGGGAVGPPVYTTFTVGPALAIPGASNWNVSVDHKLGEHLSTGVNYLRRRGTQQFAFVNTLDPNARPSLLPLPNGTAPGVYQLGNQRRDDYDAVQFTLRQTLSGQFEWMVSYTRSRALSNGVLDIHATEPLQVLMDAVPMPWDVPHRALAWAYLPLPFRNWSIAALVDARSGFPFSIVEENGVVVGDVSSHRYPFNFDLNLGIERTLTIHGYRFALRGGGNNITNHKNPTAVNNVVGSPQYLQFLGDEGRHYVIRVRFFGRGTKK
jgi:hypothetical protein